MAIDPPYRLDPFQNIINVSWGQGEVYSYAYFVLAWQGDLDWHIHEMYVAVELQSDGLAINDHFLEQLSPYPPIPYGELIDEYVIHNWDPNHTNLSYYFPEVLDYYDIWLQGDVYPLPVYRVWFENQPTTA